MKWVTESRPHVDRCASAWFIHRFVDQRPTFHFLGPGEPPPKGTIPFDLANARFGHHGRKVTFDALLAAHSPRGVGLRQLADVVRDVDLGTFRLPESRGLDAILYGILLTETDDRRVLRLTEPIFEGLYRYFSDAGAR